MANWGIVPGAVSANINTAQAISAVYQATRLIADDIAGLPIGVYRKTDTGIETVQNDLSQLLKVQIDPVTRATPFKFFSITGKVVVMRGNSFAIIHRNPRGKVTRIEFVKEGDVTIYLNDTTGEPMYMIKGRTGSYNGYFLSSEVLHFKGLGDDMYRGLSVINYAAQSLGIELASQKMEAQFYENGTIVRDYIKYPNGLGEEAFENVKKRWGSNKVGNNQSSTMKVLEHGGEYVVVRINAEDYQFIARHGKSIAEISRWFNCPPDKLFSLEKMTYASMEQSSANYALQTLAPWCKNIEQELTLKLCDTANGEYIRFNLDALIRADALAKADSIVKLVQGGIFSPNEGRAMYERNNYTGADELLFPLNSAPQSKVSKYYDAKIESMLKGAAQPDPSASGTQQT